MPIYEYKCQNCKAKFEEIVLPCNKDRKITCPGCGKSRVKKIVSKFVSQNKDSLSSSSCSSGCSSCPGCGQ